METAAFPGRQLRVILDNLNTDKKNEHWLKAHPNVEFHFTPTSASWLNQVGVWFSVLQGQSLSGASFTSLKQLQSTSMPISTHTTKKLSPSSGPGKEFGSADSEAAVSLSYDSGY
ncbi:hypothetical protein ABIB85_004485 [Bradyrhizobium sp. JR1.5]